MWNRVIVIPRWLKIAAVVLTLLCILACAVFGGLLFLRIQILRLGLEGDQLAAAGMYEEAEETLKQAMRLNAWNPYNDSQLLATTALVEVYLHSGQYEEAYRTALEQEEASDSPALFADYAGFAAVRLGKKSEAVDAFERAADYREAENLGWTVLAVELCHLLVLEEEGGEASADFLARQFEGIQNNPIGSHEPGPELLSASAWQHAAEGDYAEGRADLHTALQREVNDQHFEEYPSMQIKAGLIDSSLWLTLTLVDCEDADTATAAESLEKAEDTFTQEVHRWQQVPPADQEMTNAVLNLHMLSRTPVFEMRMADIVECLGPEKAHEIAPELMAAFGP